ncbi:MAG: tRNA pseudouridine(38-40) synthase TruA [Chromatiales bacterium]|jgi:tRNA pseudouridine38-40 synthase|nr:tRNA pseudouridine(38-40) synthase TruA [Chromatiales bacterium]
MRTALGIEYRGSAYHGWERQDNANTVQAELERALSKVAHHEVRTFCAGRTDAGVHASGQTVHFDSTADRPLRAWHLGANSHLPKDITVIWAHSVSDAFHARFSATARRYQYVIINRPSPPAILRGQVVWVRGEVDHTRMNSGAKALLGEHDFSAFRAAGCQAKSPIRTLHECYVERHNEFVVLNVVANAFLQHMVRNIAGVLIAIGLGKRDVTWASEVLATRNRSEGGVTASPDGLYLISVQYPEEFCVPKVSSGLTLWYP